MSIERDIPRIFDRGDAYSRPIEQAQKLTTRQLDVLRHAALGETYEEIGQSLSISPKTVGTHIRNVLGRLKAMDVLEAVLSCLKCQVFTLEDLSPYDSSLLDMLSPAELKVLMHYIEGFGQTSKAIAAELCLAESTVKTHFDHMHSKTGLHRIPLTLLYLRVQSEQQS